MMRKVQTMFHNGEPETTNRLSLTLRFQELIQRETDHQEGPNQRQTDLENEQGSKAGVAVETQNDKELRNRHELFYSILELRLI